MNSDNITRNRFQPPLMRNFWQKLNIKHFGFHHKQKNLHFASFLQLKKIFLIYLKNCA